MSLYEGFGLPALEAMTCGTPVIIYDVTALPEVVDTAGLCVNLCGAGEILRAKERLWRSRALHEELTVTGLKRVRSFSRDDLANRIRRSLERV